MKIFAQHGAQEGEKIDEAIKLNVIDGIVYSPRDIGIEKLTRKLDLLRVQTSTQKFFDPQFYACLTASDPEARLGNLADDYANYFQPRRRSQLEKEKQVAHDLEMCMRFQIGLPLTGVIAPNIVIPRSFDSIEAVIAKSFIRQTGEVYRSLQDSRPVYATLAVSRDALNDKRELEEFLNEITILDTPPSGFYVLIASRGAEARTDIFNADIIAGWMFINHVLHINGFKVMNGYSDTLTPFLGAAGASVGCTGWWSNLRSFTTTRFGGAGSGGRLPVQRYLSTQLLNRITFFELDQLRGTFAGIMNGLASDSFYDVDQGSEPLRNKEVIQAWGALRQLCERLVTNDQIQSLKNCIKAISKATELYGAIQSKYSLDVKSNADHLDALRDGLNLFIRMAELDEAEFL